jgi:hypothetical protein
MSESADAPSSDSPKELPAPRVEELLPNVPGGQNNLLPEAATHSDLKVWFELWEHSSPDLGEESVELFLDGGPDSVDRRTWNAFIEPSDRYVTLPQRLLRGNDGPHRLHYEATAYNNEVDDSAELEITLDTTPPVLAADSKLVFPPEVLPPNKLTARYLEQNNDELKANLPGYTNPRPWDLITWYWGTSPGNLDQGGVIELDDLNYADPIVVTIPAGLIQNRGDGWRYVWYQVEDRAGNMSLRSEPVELDVAATPIPRDLPWPSIESAVGTGEQQTLDPWVPVNGVVIVQVPDTAVIYPGEKVWVQWGEPGTLGATRVEQPISGSRRFRVEMQYLAAHIGRVLPVFYGVIDAMDQEHPSVRRRLQVRTLPSNRLEAVQCEGLSGGNLSYNSVAPEGARLTLKKWPLITTDHWVMITVTGVSSSGQDSVFPAVNKRAVTEQETFAGIGFGTEVRVLKTWLNTLRRNAPLTGKAYVSFDGGQTWPPLASPNFPLLQLTLVQ